MFFTILQIVICLFLIAVTVLFDDDLDRLPHFLFFPFKALVRAAPFLGSVGWKFAAVDGEHVPADQPDLIAIQQYIGENGANLAIHLRNKIGDGRKVRSAIVGQGHENDVFFTSFGYGTTRNDAGRVTK